jgi:hypothetical protein
VEFFYDFLADDGIMVVPVDDSNELLKIHRIKGRAVTKTCISQVHFASLEYPPLEEQQSIQLPRVLWAPIASRHKQFPSAFRQAVRCLLFGRLNAERTERCNSLPLPAHVWLEVFSYCSRDWFTPIRSPMQQVLEELAAERSLRMSVEEKLRACEALRVAADRERDLCRVSGMV